jgi:hypothetical protein
VAGGIAGEDGSAEVMRVKKYLKRLVRPDKYRAGI